MYESVNYKDVLIPSLTVLPLASLVTYPTRQRPRPISHAIAPGFEVVRVTTFALQVEHLIWE